MERNTYAHRVTSSWRDVEHTKPPSLIPLSMFCSVHWNLSSCNPFALPFVIQNVPDQEQHSTLLPSHSDSLSSHRLLIPHFYSSSSSSLHDKEAGMKRLQEKRGDDRRWDDDDEDDDDDDEVRLDGSKSCIERKHEWEERMQRSERRRRREKREDWSRSYRLTDCRSTKHHYNYCYRLVGRDFRRSASSLSNSAAGIHWSAHIHNHINSLSHTFTRATKADTRIHTHTFWWTLLNQS